MLRRVRLDRIFPHKLQDGERKEEIARVCKRERESE